MITIMMMLAYILITGETDKTWKSENVEIISFMAVIEVLFEVLFLVGVISENINR